MGDKNKGINPKMANFFAGKPFGKSIKQVARVIAIKTKGVVSVMSQFE